METKIFVISLISADIASLILAVFSVLFCWRSYNPRYLRSLPIYTLVNLCTNIVNDAAISIRPFSENAFTLFEMVYFSYFLCRITTRKNSRRAIAFLTILFVFIYFYHVYKHDWLMYAPVFITIESLFMCIACLIYFRELLLGPADVELRENPAFWMTTGILFYFALLFPCMILTGYLTSKPEVGLLHETYSINNYAQLVTYFLFIKAMLCLRNR